MARIITITSGKGGVGKTSISLNLSLSLAREGHRVCLFDADLGLANVNILTGLHPQTDLASVIAGKSSLQQIMIKDYMGIDIIPGSSGVEKMADLTREQTDRLISAFLDLDDYDFFIFDTSAGISAQVLSFCMASHEIILVATCEPTSLTDAYSLLKVLSKYNYRNPVRAVINQVTAGKDAKRAYQRLKQTTARFLKIPLKPLGIVAADRNVKAAVISQTPFFELFPETVATRCIESIRQRLLAQKGQDIPMELFWDKALSFIDTHYAKKKESSFTPPEIEKPEPPAAMHPELVRQLSVLEEKITHLANDVTIIKQMLKRQQEEGLILNVGVPENVLSTETRPPAENRENRERRDEPVKGPVSLDFESWYLQRKNS